MIRRDNLSLAVSMTTERIYLRAVENTQTHTRPLYGGHIRIKILACVGKMNWKAKSKIYEHVRLLGTG